MREIKENLHENDLEIQEILKQKGEDRIKKTIYENDENIKEVATKIEAVSF